jgi:monosaccharide-transporting ATPase
LHMQPGGLHYGCQAERASRPQPDPDVDTPLLEMRGVSKRFPGVQALDRVDFTVRRGEIHALMGENGAGKSTLIKVLTGVHPRDAGRITFDGRPLEVRSPRAAEAAGISTVYQEINLIPHLSVAENICLGREPTALGTIRWGAVERRAAAALARLGLRIDLHRPLANCRVATQQLVAIARALDVSARLLILDEPTSSLDAAEVEELFAILRRLRAEGIGIVFVTHFLQQVFAVSDRVTVLRDGRLVGEFETATLTRAELVAHMLGRELAPAAAPALEDTRSGRPPRRPCSPAAPGRHSERSGVQTGFIEARGLGRRGSIAPFDLQLRRGETTGLAGLLGSGRTEMARLLFGVDRADSGELRVGGRRVTLRGPRDAIALGFGLLPEDRKAAGVISDLSVRENIILALQARRGIWRYLSRRAADEIANALIRILGIRVTGLGQAAATLSGGNQQKLLLARWLATRPTLLILDEPTRGIDVGAKAEIERLIEQLRREGMAIVFISSELDEILRNTQRVVVLRDRAKVAELSGREIEPDLILRAIAAHEHAS